MTALEHHHAKAAASRFGGGGEARWTAAHHDDVSVVGRVRHQATIQNRERGRMASMPRYDVVVVGGGAMGAASARALAARGQRVAMVEQFDAGHDRGSSHGRSRIFRLAYQDPAYVPLAQRALMLWRELSDECGASLLTTTGGIDHGPAEILDEIAAGLAAQGVTSARLSAAEDGRTLARHALRRPSVVPARRRAGRRRRDGACAAPARGQFGADVLTGERVHDIQVTADGIEVVTGARTLVGAVVVVAAGAWLPKLAPGLGLAGEVPDLVVTQEQPAYFDAVGAEDWPVFVHYGDRSHYGLFTPDVGVKVGEHGTGVVVDPDARPPADDERVRRLSSYVERWLPGADPHRPGWTPASTRRRRTSGSSCAGSATS